MEKYILVAKNAWDEMLTYRLNIVMWRVRNIFQILTLYFLWNVILPPTKTFAGYSHSLMLTYVLLTSIVSSIVWSSKTIQVGDDINEGNLSNFLIKPMSYIKYWFAKDVGDKAMNTLFSAIELTLLFFILKPPFFIQTNIIYITLSSVSLLIAIVLYFYLNFLLGLIGFWTPETWAPRFLLYNVMTFFAGGLFPLDILPKQLYVISQLLPFQYMLYFPIRLYLGKITQIEIIFGLLVSLTWTFVLLQLVNYVWRNGLRSYSAYGQ